MPDNVRYQKTKRSTACRECQRLKLKCSRSWPCDPCLKRGVGDICPEGVLPTAKQQRLNLIEASRLYEHNTQMSERIRKLEAALANLQGSVSQEPHPLLKEDLLALGTPLEPPPHLCSITPTAAVQPVEDTIQAFGTLTIGENGRTIFHSQGVSADYLVEPTKRSIDRPITETSSLTPEILNLIKLFPFGDSHLHSSNLKHQILWFLPPLQIVAHAAQNYFDYFSWWLDPVPREQFDQEISPILTSYPDTISAGRLSVLFMILGIGTFLDVKRPVVDIALTDYYWQLSRAAFCLEPLVDSSTVYTIQALQLMAAYIHMTRRNMVEHQWVIMGLISRIIHSSGLHYDGEHWLRNAKDDRIIERRRKVFYEAVTFDVMMSFGMGRPAAFTPAHMRTNFPFDDETIITEAGTEEYGPSTWRYRFTMECIYPVMNEALGSKPPSYSTILRLDRTLRDFPVPSQLAYPGLGDLPEEPNPDKVTIRKWMQRAYLLTIRETSLLYLHRNYFSQALIDNPADPFASKYAPSVLAAFRSASRIIAGAQDISSRYETLVSRFWGLWQNLLAAAITLGTLVLRAPRCKLAQSAFEGLGQANELMQHGVMKFRSESARRVMEKLLRQATSNIKTGQPVTTTCGMGLFDPDELIFIIPVPRTFSYENLPESDTLPPASRPSLIPTVDSVNVGASGATTGNLKDAGSGTYVEQSFLPPTDVIPDPAALLEFSEPGSTYENQTETEGQWEDFMYHANRTL